MNLTLTPAAEKFIRRLLRFDGGPSAGLRLRVSPGGCSGIAADFNVEKAPGPGEKAFEIATGIDVDSLAPFDDDPGPMVLDVAHRRLDGTWMDDTALEIAG
jgi:hypothetical protein